MIKAVEATSDNTCHSKTIRWLKTTMIYADRYNYLYKKSIAGYKFYVMFLTFAATI